jgi:hypothetical protein
MAPLVAGATHADAPEASEQALVLARLRYLAAHEVGTRSGSSTTWRRRRSAGAR